MIETIYISAWLTGMKLSNQAWNIITFSHNVTVYHKTWKIYEKPIMCFSVMLPTNRQIDMKQVYGSK